MHNHSSTDARAARTRRAIIDAFIDLALKRRYDAIRVSHLIASANVGKSTFYEHFYGKNDVLVVAMQPVILALSTAASGRAARLYVRNIVRHIWEHRSTGRHLLGPNTAPILQRHLANAITPHVKRAGWPTDASIVLATGIASAQLAMLRGWVAGEVTSTVDVMTKLLIDCSGTYIK